MPLWFILVEGQKLLDDKNIDDVREGPAAAHSFFPRSPCQCGIRIALKYSPKGDLHAVRTLPIPLPC
jgi:hypothetical protein